MDVQDISYNETTAGRSNHFLLPQRSIRCLIIGKSDCGKSTLMNNLLHRPGWLDYDRLHVFGKSLHQPIYQLLEKALKKGYSKDNIREQLSIKDKCSASLIDVIDTLPPPMHRSGIDAFFFEQYGDFPDPRELDANRKNLMVLDDLMMSKQNKCEDYYVRAVAEWLPQRLQEELTWNSTANLSGRPGNNLALDLENEFQNNEFKSNLKNAHGQYSDRQVQRCSRLVGSLEKGIENIFESKKMHQYCKKAKSSRHSHKDLVKKIVKRYLPENLFDRNFRRQHPGFSGFNNAVVVNQQEKLSCRLKKYSKVLKDEAYILED